jgi:transposase
MAMGTRKMRERQEELWYGGELPTAPGHPFYKRLNEVLDKAKFDSFCETACAGFYHLTYAQNYPGERPERLT